MEGGSRGAGADVGSSISAGSSILAGSSISAGSIVSSDVGGTDERRVIFVSAVFTHSII